MAHNLRTTTVNGEKYVSVHDVLRMILDVATMDSLHPYAVQALDGFGTGLAISLDVVKINDLPDFLKKLKLEADNVKSGNSQG